MGKEKGGEEEEYSVEKVLQKRTRNGKVRIKKYEIFSRQL